MAARKPSQASLNRKLRGLEHVPDPVRSIQNKAAAEARWAGRRGKVSSALVAEVTRANLEKEAKVIVKAQDSAWLHKFQKRQTVATLSALALASENAVLAVRTVTRLMSDDNQPGMVRLLAAKSVMEWARWERAASLLDKPEDELTPEQIEAQIEADLATLAAIEGEAVPVASEMLTETPTD